MNDSGAETAEMMKELDRKSRIRTVYDASVKKKVTYMILVVLALVASFIASVALGAADIPFVDTLKAIAANLFPWMGVEPSEPYYTNFVYARSSRAFLCILTGMSLAIAGAVMQGTLRNPLVSPFTLGVSSAASFGAAMGLVFWPMLFGAGTTTIVLFGTKMTDQDFFTVAMAFLFGLLSILFVVLMTRNRNISRSTVILAGVIVSYLFQAGVSLAKYLSSDESLREITNWLLGGMWKATMGVDMLIFPVVMICAIYLMYVSPKINILAAGDEVAESLGVDVNRLRNRSLVVSTLMTSVCLAFTGIIGFIGLMAPHICRLIIGSDTRYLLPASAITGAFILLTSDTVSRIILRPQEIPVGIAMYILGGIFFMWMMLRRRKEVVI